jgi:hypothetical protein
LHEGGQIFKTGGTKISPTLPPSEHSLPQAPCAAVIALLCCQLFSTPALAADVAFSSDNQRIYAPTTTDNVTTRALREIDLSTNTARVIPSP